MVFSAPDIISEIKNLTSKSSSAQGPANQINIINTALAVSGLGPVPIVITRLTDIVTTCAGTVGQFAGTKPYPDKKDEDDVLNAFMEFVKVHQGLLNILIGKAGLVPQLLPFVAPPLASVLRQLESVLDSFAFELIETCQHLSEDLTSQKESLDRTITMAIDTWSATGAA